MNNKQLPSGPWTGFFNYGAGGQRHRTDMSLSFDSGRITGEGADGVGVFVIDGHYDSQANECWWTKSYVGRHEVSYTGFCEEKSIWGTWTIEQDAHGGFRIWPVGDEPAESVSQSKEEPAPAELVRSRK